MTRQPSSLSRQKAPTCFTVVDENLPLLSISLSGRIHLSGHDGIGEIDLSGCIHPFFQKVKRAGENGGRKGREKCAPLLQLILLFRALMIA
jgi:hypothetical protein